jgi:hypothetical protein
LSESENQFFANETTSRPKNGNSIYKYLHWNFCVTETAVPSFLSHARLCGAVCTTFFLLAFDSGPLYLSCVLHGSEVYLINEVVRIQQEEIAEFRSLGMVERLLEMVFYGND